ncbi:hypothetical protein DFJ63DRAFT_127575 [Scheffersomyces coipomensis]|uniref:uncharacterized protein n=1 Tax=Scheffersomyces coipomensis TaxID=1788519 RepID=UPI00315D691F
MKMFNLSLEDNKPAVFIIITMIRVPRFAKTYEGNEFSFDELFIFNQTTLPDTFKFITDLVLLVDTTKSDNFDNLLIPDIPIKGQVLHHNDRKVDYEDSSKLFFDNAKNFDNKSFPLTITLQFKLGLEDDGMSMRDLLFKAIELVPMGFKFKVYIFKIVSHQGPDTFRMPPADFLRLLNCIGFRFDTDFIPNAAFTSQQLWKRDYHRNVNHHIPITISWLGKDLEELHLGQKVRLASTDYIYLEFQKLIDHSYECYDVASIQNWSGFLVNNNSSFKYLKLRDFQTGYYCPFVGLDKLVLIGFELPIEVHKMFTYLLSSKEIHLCGVAIQQCPKYFENVNSSCITEMIYFSCDPAWSDEITQTSIESLQFISLKFQINLFEVPFLPQHQASCKTGAIYNQLHRRVRLGEFECK